jgi:hypothetical protein
MPSTGETRDSSAAPALDRRRGDEYAQPAPHAGGGTSIMVMVPAPQSLLLGVPSQRATAAVLMSAAAVTILVGLIRSPRASVRLLPAGTFVLLGAALLWPLPFVLQPWSRAMTVAAACALVAHFVLDSRTRDARIGSRRASAVYLCAALLVAAALLLHDLAGSGRPLHRWEASVVGGYPDIGPCTTALNATRAHCSVPFGFAHPFETGQSVLRYVTGRFVWDEGILSSGNTSLFYGAPTYALFHALGFSSWTLRFPAAVAMLLSIVVIYALARRFFGPVAGGAAAMLLGLNTCALFYGRYGSSPAGTVLAVLLAILATWLFLDHERPPWWAGALCAASLYAATLQYAPGRLVVLVLLGLILLVVIGQRRRLSRQRVVGCAVIVALAVAVWAFEGWAGGQHAFLFGRGEQYFYMTKFPDYVASICPTCRELGETSPRAAQIELLRSWLHITGPQYLAFIRPSVQNAPLRDWDVPMLPNLYYGPLCLFIVWGLGRSLRHWRSWRHAFLLLWVSGVSVTLLLTNRVDSHRIVLFVIPVSLWGALGIREAAHVMTEAMVPRALQHLFAASLALTVASNDAHLLWYPRFAQPAAGYVLADELARVPGPAAVGALIDESNRGIVALAMLERERRDPARPGFFVSPAVLTALQQDGAAPAAANLLDGATVILAPAGQFQAASAALQERGVSIQKGGTTAFAVLRLTGATQSSQGTAPLATRSD